MRSRYHTLQRAPRKLAPACHCEYAIDGRFHSVSHSLGALIILVGIKYIQIMGTSLMYNNTPLSAKGYLRNEESPDREYHLKERKVREGAVIPIPRNAGVRSASQ